MGAGRIAFTEVAFDDFIMDFIDQSTSERTGGDTSHTFDTAGDIKVNGAGLLIAAQGIEHTGLNTGSVVTLQANHRHVLVFSMRQRIDAASSLLEVTGMAEGASQFAGAASGAERRVNNEAVFHLSIS